MGSITAKRKVTITFEGVDARGESFTFSRTVAAGDELGGRRPYAEQMRQAADRALDAIEASVEAIYGATDVPRAATARA